MERRLDRQGPQETDGYDLMSVSARAVFGVHLGLGGILEELLVDSDD